MVNWAKYAPAWGVPFIIIAAILIMAKWPVLRHYDGREPIPQPAQATAG